MMNEKRVPENTRERMTYIPAADIFETQDLYTLKLEMPGMTKDSLEIVIDENELRINGKHAEEKEGGNLKYAEFEPRDYQRVFKIGTDIDRNRIEAKLEDGVLTLTLHKTEEVKPKKITISHTN